MTTRTRSTGDGRASRAIAGQPTAQAVTRPAPAPGSMPFPALLASWAVAAVLTARPKQWPKNLLVFAAPLAGATLGRDDGFAYALVAFAAFTAASSAVYFINDLADADRDRTHPTKRLRPIASGRLPVPVALAIAAFLIAVAILAGFWIGEPRLAAVVGGYFVLSLGYSMGLKHVPYLELAFVAVGFVFRAIGGAVATHVPPSAWFLTVCSLGALMVAIGKRYIELSVLGPDAARHRPVMRWYRLPALRAAQRTVTLLMWVSYLAWALTASDGWIQGWHLASAGPLALALFRFDQLTGAADGRPVEDLISRDPMMVCCELTWLALFTIGL